MKYLWDFTIVGIVVLCSGCSSLYDYDSDRFNSMPEYNDFRLNLNVINDVLYGHSSASQNLPEDWESRFRPWTGSMDTERKTGAFSWNLGVGIEPILITDNDWQLGIPISTGFSVFTKGKDFTRDMVIAYTEVDWWNDATVIEVNLRKSTSVGFSAAKDKVKFTYSVHKYKVFLEDMEGVDIYGGHNYSEPVNKVDIDDGLGHRIDISIASDYSSKKYWNYGLFYERNGDVWLVGISLKWVYGLLY